jgi:uncharacterized protein (DUF1697 family)
MPLHVAFLRGMNLGGRRITNADLGAAFEDLGFEDVTTYRASGNVIFSASGQSEGELIAEIEEGLEETLGYEVPTFVRTEGEVESIADFDPFDLDTVAKSKGKLQVMLLSKRPTKKQHDEVMALATEQDPLVIAERELYWLPSGGTLESDLDVDAIAKILGPTTQRTKGTIEGIASKLRG